MQDLLPEEVDCQCIFYCIHFDIGVKMPLSLEERWSILHIYQHAEFTITHLLMRAVCSHSLSFHIQLFFPWILYKRLLSLSLTITSFVIR